MSSNIKVLTGGPNDETHAPSQHIKYLEEHHHICETSLGLLSIHLQAGDLDKAQEQLESTRKKIDAILKEYQPLTWNMINNGV